MYLESFSGEAQISDPVYLFHKKCQLTIYLSLEKIRDFLDQILLYEGQIFLNLAEVVSL